MNRALRSIHLSRLALGGAVLGVAVFSLIGGGLGMDRAAADAVGAVVGFIGAAVALKLLP